MKETFDIDTNNIFYSNKFENRIIKTNEGYEMKFTPIVNILIITLKLKDSTLYESKNNLEELKNYKIFSNKNINEIINNLIDFIKLRKYSIKENDSIITFEIFPNWDSSGKIQIIFNKIKGQINQIEKLIKDINQFFTCIFCKKIISEPYSCKCPQFVCKECFLETPKEKCQKCSAPFEEEKDIDLNYVLSEIFQDKKIKKEKINFYILLLKNLKDLYLNKKMRMIVKHTPDFNDLTPIETFNLIDNLTSESIIDNFKDFDNKFTPLNLLDLISTLGVLINKYINDSKKSGKNTFIDIKNALKCKKDSSSYISGILARFLQEQGINVAIEKKTTCPKLTKSLLDWIMIGLLKFRKIQLHLNYGNKRNEEILYNEEEKNKIIEYWMEIISMMTKIKKSDLFFVSIKKGSIELTFSTQEEFDESTLSNLTSYEVVKDVKFKMLLEGCLISEEMFDTKWNNEGGGWARKGEKRGGAEYDPPLDYFGYGLKVSQMYDNQNDTWLGMRNIEGEWWVAYHGAGRFINDNDQMKELIKNIVYDGLKPGRNQAEQDIININTISQNEYSHVGQGVYLSNKINTAEGYAGKVKDDMENKYQIVFMCRVCPRKVRISEKEKDYFVLDPNKDCIRPYRILLKKINSLCSIY